MFHSRSLSSSAVRYSLIAFVIALGATRATHASEHGADAKPAASSAKAAESDKASPADKAVRPEKAEKFEKSEKKVVKAAETEEVVPASLPRPRVIREPMDVIRERLAEKLNNPKATEPAGNNELRVVSNMPATAVEHAAPNAAAAPGTRIASVASVASIHSMPRRAVRAARQPEPGPQPIVVGSAEAPHDAHWDYQGLGNPETWGRLKPEFSKCGSGTRQSPIDIRDGIKVQLDPVVFSYRESAFTVVDNGHTVQVDVGPGSSIEVMGHRYELVQFHFHRPSEERINGRQFDMSVHLVHKDADGRLAVIAVELDRGSVHPVVQKVWNNLPLEKGDSVAARSTIDIEALLPQDRRYFTYMGSLTTPPCSEGVLWMVMKQPVEVASEQIGIFARLYPMNARPVQQASGRLIKESN